MHADFADNFWGTLLVGSMLVFRVSDISGHAVEAEPLILIGGCSIPFCGDSPLLEGTRPD